LLKDRRNPWKIYGRYVHLLNDLRANGVTIVASAGYNVPPILARIAASRNFSPRIRQFFYMTEDELQYLPASPDNGDDFFRVLGIKLWHDGSPYTGSMYTTHPYLDSPLGRTIPVQQAFHAMTINGAYQLRLQDKTGSLEPGKWADLQVVDRNPYATPVQELDRIKTLSVYVKGRQQFKAN